jgi:hypothetical protein
LQNYSTEKLAHIFSRTVYQHTPQKAEPAATNCSQGRNNMYRLWLSPYQDLEILERQNTHAFRKLYRLKYGIFLEIIKP